MTSEPDETALGNGPPRDHSADPGRFGHGQFAPGTVLASRYRVVGLLGRGGMGEVYRADDLRLALARRHPSPAYFWYREDRQPLRAPALLGLYTSLAGQSMFFNAPEDR